MGIAASLSILAALQASPAPSQVTVQPATALVPVDSSLRLEAAAYDADGERLQFDRQPRWFTPDDEIVSVDANGVVTARRPGEAKVVALLRGKSGQAVITVPQLPPDALALALEVEAIPANTTALLAVTARTRLGDEVETTGVRLESADGAIAEVDESGRVWAGKVGTTTIRATLGEASAEIAVRVIDNPATTYELQPRAAVVQTGDVVRFQVMGRSRSGQELHGYRPLWSVSGAGSQIEPEGEQGVFVAEEPGTYRVTARVGANQTLSSTVEVEPRRARGQLSKVGRGPIRTHHSADMWVFEGVDGRDYAYVGTFGHDWMMAFDVTDPTRPVVTDSVQVDARRINDVKIHPANRLAIITREGASDRHNGIVLLDLAEPAHPVILSEYTETVTGGVHNVWIRGDQELVYLAHNGTSEMHIVDISDPSQPHEVGRWGLDKEGKTLHDVIVQDGYAYLSYWNDGLIMLDVGAGSHGGTPTEPQLVSQFKYPVGHTHTAWRHGRYLFVGDEIFPPDWDADRPIEAAGYVHVIDYSDIERPREVARYEVPEAGAHNFWVEDDLLYVGYYQGGLRVVDVSGELRGDLYRQGRELAVLKTTDADAVVPNWPMAFGAQPFKGNLFLSDFNSGLWIARFQGEPLVP